jgi:hypothetical protein
MPRIVWLLIDRRVSQTLIVLALTTSDKHITKHKPKKERNALLQQAADSGAIENYEGWRRSVKGRRFKIRGVRLFNVTELTGALVFSV